MCPGTSPNILVAHWIIRVGSLTVCILKITPGPKSADNPCRIRVSASSPPQSYVSHCGRPGPSGISSRRRKLRDIVTCKIIRTQVTPSVIGISRIYRSTIIAVDHRYSWSSHFTFSKVWTTTHATPRIGSPLRLDVPRSHNRPWARTTHHAPPPPPPRTHFTQTNFFLNLDYVENMKRDVNSKNIRMNFIFSPPNPSKIRG